MTGPQTLTALAVKMFVERNMVVPMRIGLKPFDRAEDGRGVRDSPGGRLPLRQAGRAELLMAIAGARNAVLVPAIRTRACMSCGSASHALPSALESSRTVPQARSLTYGPQRFQ